MQTDYNREYHLVAKCCFRLELFNSSLDLKIKHVSDDLESKFRQKEHPTTGALQSSLIGSFKNLAPVIFIYGYETSKLVVGPFLGICILSKLVCRFHRMDDILFPYHVHSYW